MEGFALLKNVPHQLSIYSVLYDKIPNDHILKVVPTHEDFTFNRARGYGLKSMSLQAKLTALAVNLKRIAALISFYGHEVWQQIATFAAYPRLPPLFRQVC